MGASDPTSGIVAVQEVVRGLGTLMRKGWKPLRTILIASWDAEEVCYFVFAELRLTVVTFTVWPHREHRVGRRFPRIHPTACCSIHQYW
jgi:hypothetical protein